MKRIKFIYVILLMVMGGMIAASCNKETENAVDNSVDTIIYDATDWVDLGLPSGLLWATRNVGASSPTGYGDYFAWGETEPKSVYDWNTYRYYIYDYGSTKYNDADGLTTLQAGDDAATAHYGGHTPDIDEWKELNENTTSKWTSIDGVYGICFTGSNGNSLFLPAAGDRGGSELLGAGSYGGYWAASLDPRGDGNAWYFYFLGDYVYWNGSYVRGNGFSVRAVRSAR